MAFQSDYQEFAPLPGGNLGTSMQSQVLHMKSRGKGPGLFMKLIKNMMNNRILPKNVRFSFEEQDLDAEQAQADISKTRAEARKMRIEAGELLPVEARQIAVDEGDLPQALFEATPAEDITPPERIVTQEGGPGAEEDVGQKGESEVSPEVNPFGLLKTEIGIRQMEPARAGPFEDDRLKAERRLERALNRAFRKNFDAVKKRLRRENRATKEIRYKQLGDLLDDTEFWGLRKEEFMGEVGDQGLKLLLGGGRQAERLGLTFDFNLVNQDALRKTQQFTNRWWQELSTQTREGMRTAIATHIESGAPLRVLNKNLEPLFGKARANVIARTEVTRMYAEGNRIAYGQAGIRTVEWRTVRDANVDPVCDDLHGVQMPLGQEQIVPPAHPRCRCLTDNQLFIQTAKGPVRFKNLKVGDLVLTHKGRFQPITEIMTNRNDTRRKVKLFVKQKERFWGKYALKKLPVTDDHPVWTPDGWKEVKDLIVGDTIYLAGKLCTVCGQRMAYIGQQTCSEHCAGQLRARGLWDNPQSREQAQKAMSAANFRSYRNGRDKKESTRVARQAQIEKNGRIGANIDEEFHRKGMKALGQRNRGSFLERKMAWLLDKEGVSYERNQFVKVNGNRYFPDFVLSDYNIVVECDGIQWHPKPNPIRDSNLSSLGYRVLHLTEQEIRNDLAGCMQAINSLIANDHHEYGLVEAEVMEIRETHRSSRASKVTYNLEVGEDHSFVAAGFVVHNCWLAPVVNEKPIEKRDPEVEFDTPFIKEEDVPAWLEDSVNKEISVHRTTVRGKESILKDGVRVERGQRIGGQFGQGFYTSTRDEEGYGDEAIRVAIRLRNPLHVGLKNFERIMGQAHRSGDFRQDLLDQGYDGVIFKLIDGGNWVVSFLNRAVKIIV